MSPCFNNSLLGKDLNVLNGQFIYKRTVVHKNMWLQASWVKDQVVCWCTVTLVLLLAQNCLIRTMYVICQPIYLWLELKNVFRRCAPNITVPSVQSFYFHPPTLVLTSFMRYIWKKWRMSNICFLPESLIFLLLYKYLPTCSVSFIKH